jgi:putative protease
MAGYSKMELVSPAGSLEKLRYAYLFGADASYIGISGFSLRNRAENFSGDDYAHVPGIKRGKKLYCALNIYFHDAEIAKLEQSIDYIGRYPIDAFIVSDIGILPLLKKRFPTIPLHLSTQANCINSEAAKLYADLGCTRIIPGRELSLAEIETIKARTGLEIEVFVHGAICLAYAGRCFLSAYMASRSANTGDCSHPCRWKYLLLEESKRPGESFPVIEGDGYTTILSSRDMCMIRHLAEIRDAGVDAIKIEGRMKSIYYTAVTTRAYRKALDALDCMDVPDLEDHIAELYRVSHREYTTGFFFGKEEMERPATVDYLQSHDFLGLVGESSGVKTWLLDVRNRITNEDTLEYIGPDAPVIEDRDFALFDAWGNDVEKTDHMKICFIKTDKPIAPGFIVRRKAGSGPRDTAPTRPPASRYKTSAKRGR